MLGPTQVSREGGTQNVAGVVKASSPPQSMPNP